MSLTSMIIENWVKEVKTKSPYMKKIKVDDCICHGKLVDHNKVKDRILSEIEKDYCTEVSGQSDPHAVCDNVSKLDWTKGHDLTRPWVKIFFPNFDITIKNYIKEIKTACLWKKKSSSFTPDFCPILLENDPWIVQPSEYYDEVDIEALKKKHS